MARDGLRRQVTQDVGLRCPDANKEKRRDAVRSVAVWCWLRFGRVLALRVLALVVLLDSRCVVVCSHFVVERVEERERFDFGGVDALADNQL